ncbi:cytochrome b/b6 domain-containing protein [Elioraea rosea]|uniref:cytochrome b/b6 domain-containing protein n=1 Tax=Elioraea rosea TaxID=2492390 RepID=UPI001185BB74|nr:cytochrome b/b6 domain-containing protein [Elioraea rosea]
MGEGRAAPGHSAELREVLVWDLPTRIFHWSLVLLLIGSVVTVNLHEMALHALCGYAILTLVVWRLLWGLLGSENARFVHFVKGPRGVVGHLGHMLRRSPDREAGHNALGGWAVLALLLLVGAQAVTGLFANDDVLFRGPLFRFVGKAMSDRITSWHYTIKDVLIVMVCLHIAAALFYRFVLRHRLVEAMVTGRKALPRDASPPALAGPLRALLLLGLSAAAVRGVVTLA